MAIQPGGRAVPGFPLTIGPTYPGGVPTPYLDKDGKTLWAPARCSLAEYRPGRGHAALTSASDRGVKAGSYNAQLNGGLPTPDSAIKVRFGNAVVLTQGGFKLSMLDND
jgi:iron complex outermembrane receptor protein